MSKFQCISIDQAEDLLQQSNCQLLDYRDVNAYRAGHVDGALHVHEELMKSLVTQGDKTQPVVVYCYHGHSSQRLAEMLANVGFDKVFSVNGGFEGWRGRLGK